MATLEFDALDYRSDQDFAPAHYRFDGDENGWCVQRDGRVVLELGPGYRLLRSERCGICSTDLARHLLPFPLPQVIGHEVVAIDGDGRRLVVEINASHTARDVATDCRFCEAGLPTQCPDRLTLGIHDLPGGFGPWILAPVGACIEVPDAVPDGAAVLIEPFAAALHAVRTVAPQPGERIAVLGPRRLGMLVVAALAGVRAQRRDAGGDFHVTALVRDAGLLDRLRSFGADAAQVVDDRASDLADASFDVVIDTTGNPEALATAVRLARREVHLKSTHGHPACGLSHLTELVVDEISIERLPVSPDADGVAPWDRLRTGTRPRIAWLPTTAPPAWLTAAADVRCGDATMLSRSFAGDSSGLPRADVAVTSTPEQVDAAIRPVAGQEFALVRPRGAILVPADAEVSESPLLAAVARRGLRLSSSRCGDFRAALALLAADPALCRGIERLVTHRFDARDLPAAFATARSRACIKAVVAHAACVGGQ
jgi:threonine dehydrogenase-like Zn-dependent dehydrogenase